MPSFLLSRGDESHWNTIQSWRNAEKRMNQHSKGEDNLASQLLLPSSTSKWLVLRLKFDYTSLNSNDIKELLLSCVVRTDLLTITPIRPTLRAIVIILRRTEKLTIFIPTFFNGSPYVAVAIR